jgi:hypothetical protein
MTRKYERVQGGEIPLDRQPPKCSNHEGVSHVPYKEEGRYSYIHVSSVVLLEDIWSLLLDRANHQTLSLEAIPN